MSALIHATELQKKFGELVQGPLEFLGEVTLDVTDSARIHEVCQHAKTERGFDYLIDVSSVDHFGEEPRFTVVYELYGLKHQCHLRLRTSVSEEQAELPTVSSVWRTAEWHEREVYDMMGIRFSGSPGPASHPDVGGLSVLSASERFSAGRQTDGSDGRRVYRTGASAGWAICDHSRCSGRSA